MVAFHPNADLHSPCLSALSVQAASFYHSLLKLQGIGQEALGTIDIGTHLTASTAECPPTERQAQLIRSRYSVFHARLEELHCSVKKVLTELNPELDSLTIVRLRDTLRCTDELLRPRTFESPRNYAEAVIAMDVFESQVFNHGFTFKLALLEQEHGNIGSYYSLAQALAYSFENAQVHMKIGENVIPKIDFERLFALSAIGVCVDYHKMTRSLGVGSICELYVEALQTRSFGGAIVCDQRTLLHALQSIDVHSFYVDLRSADTAKISLSQSASEQESEDSYLEDLLIAIAGKQAVLLDRGSILLSPEGSSARQANYSSQLKVWRTGNELWIDQPNGLSPILQFIGGEEFKQMQAPEDFKALISKSLLLEDVSPVQNTTYYQLPSGQVIASFNPTTSFVNWYFVGESVDEISWERAVELETLAIFLEHNALQDYNQFLSMTNVTEDDIVDLLFSLHVVLYKYSNSMWHATQAPKTSLSNSLLGEESVALTVLPHFPLGYVDKDIASADVSGVLGSHYELFVTNSELDFEESLQSAILALDQEMDRGQIAKLIHQLKHQLYAYASKACQTLSDTITAERARVLPDFPHEQVPVDCLSLKFSLGYEQDPLTGQVVAVIPYLTDFSLSPFEFGHPQFGGGASSAYKIALKYDAVQRRVKRLIGL